MRIKDKTKKKIQGSISVLLVIILLPMMTFSAAIVDISRINMAKQMMSSAGDLTMNTALANYDTILKDVYGLFAMSQLEGMDNDQLGKELNEYFAKTLSSYGIVSSEDADDYVKTLIGDFRDILNEGNIDTKSFLELNNISLTAEKVEGSSLANASIMRKQIVEYMKYRAPMGLGLSFLDSLTSFKKMDAQNKVVEAQVKAQESTQDVTNACKKLITLIREYDKRVVEINAALTGASNKNDTTVIPLEDYDTHVSKYLSAWGENYTHINKLTLVFLANAPSADDVYLKSLAYSAGERYINDDGTLYDGSNSGISVSVSLAADTAGAKKQIDEQIKNLNNNYYGYTKQYQNSMLSSTLLTHNANNINAATISKDNEDDAISNFIKFENFLLDRSGNNSINYSQVKAVLEQIAILDKYRANYETKIDEEISAAESEKQIAESKLNALISDRDSAKREMNSCISGINNSIKSYLNGSENKIGSILDSLPACSGDYSKYYDSYIKSSSGDEDKYYTYYSSLTNTNSSASGTGSPKNGSADKGKGNDSSKLADCLKTCHEYAVKYNGKISTYNEAVEQIPGAQSEFNKATQKVDGLKKQKTSVINSVKGCLQGYDVFATAYQADAYYYNHYINAAKNTVTSEVQKVQTHFALLLAYLKELRDDLNAINAQIVNVKNAITNYNSNLTTWNNANTNYVNSNGGDSFSSQAAGDIEKAKTEYDAALYDTLDTFVIAMWNEYDDLYTKLTEPTNFTYGSKRIDEIASADDLIAAISGTSFSDVVTVDEATQKLSTLYKGETIEYNPYTMDYTNPKQLGFLSPQILQIQALKYLNSTYPEAIQLTCGGCGDCSECKDKKKQDDTKAEYETTKNKLTGKDKTVDSSGENNSGDEDANTPSDVPEKVDCSGFGYTYEGLSLKENLPSSGATLDTKTYTESEHTISSSGEGDEERLDVSTSVSSQSSTSGGFLSKLGDIATTAVENLYILNYVFENFSYSTVVQEQINKDVKLTSTSLLGQLAEAKTNFAVADNVTNAKKNITTLSNFKIDENNNYLYGGEIEYILFGNKTPSSNVTSMRASIYAIRFGFNCIFAFTNSEIRNTTMAAGLAVQAATLGVVPYQVVQIVLQLALAAAESAIDLSAMNHGISVAVVKTKDTWSLSMSGASTALKDAGNAAAQMLTDRITDCATKAISSVTNGLNDLIDAGADELESAITGVANSLENSAQGLLESVADDILTAIMTEIEEGLNGLQYVQNGTDEKGLDRKVTITEVETKAGEIFTTLRGKLDSIITNACGGNQMALGIADVFKRYANQMVNQAETQTIETINKAKQIENVDITSYINSCLIDIKLMVIEKGNLFIKGISERLQTEAQAAVKDTKEKIQGYINQCGENLTEEAAEMIKTEITAATDSLMESTLKINTSSTSTEIKSSPMSLFKFGYKDYLMLLTYISICCNDTSVLTRTADVIQMNLQHSFTTGEFRHKANKADGSGSFLMSKAYTYISVSATADLDMFFMNLGIFADQVAENTEKSGGDEEDTENTEKPSDTKITYKGLLGY